VTVTYAIPLELTMTTDERLGKAAEAGNAAFFCGKGGDPHMDSIFWDLVEDLPAADRQRVHVAWVDGWIAAPMLAAVGGAT